jgi:hypothetical protein
MLKYVFIGFDLSVILILLTLNIPEVEFLIRNRSYTYNNTPR